MTAQEWKDAKEHFDLIREMYQDLEGMPGVNTTVALQLVFTPLAIRYNNGERSVELYNEMKEVE